MAETKTKPTSASVDEFLARIDDPQRRADSDILVELMQRLTGEPAQMWGPTIVGFGSYHYKYASGHEGDSSIIGFSPRAAEFSIYLNGIHFEGVSAKRDDLLTVLGRHRMGKGCLYVKRLDAIDVKVLEKLLKLSVDAVQKAYPPATP